MNSQTTQRGLFSSLGLGWYAAVVTVSTAAAQTPQGYYQQPQGGYQQPYNQPPPSYYPPQQPGYGYPQQPPTQYESPLQFLPKFGQRMSEMARRLFYGRNPTGYDNPPSGYGQNGGYNLDSTPRQQPVPNYPQQQAVPNYPQQPTVSGYPQSQPGYPQQPGYQYPQQQAQAQPRYNYPPQQPPAPIPQPSNATHGRSSTPPPAAPKSTTSSSTHKYTPPKVTDAPPPTKAPSKSAKVTHKKEPKPDAPPQTPEPKLTQTQTQSPTPTTRRSETTPKEFPTTASSGGSSGSFLKGKKTAKAGRVISPYPPYKELDITGLESGSLALDPTTQKVFEVP